jgi:hypothetical protein
MKKLSRKTTEQLTENQFPLCTRIQEATAFVADYQGLI